MISRNTDVLRLSAHTFHSLCDISETSKSSETLERSA